MEDQRLRSEDLHDSDRSVDSEEEGENKGGDVTLEETKPKRKPWEKAHQKKKAGGNKKKAKPPKRPAIMANAEEVVDDKLEEPEKGEKPEDDDAVGHQFIFSQKFRVLILVPRLHQVETMMIATLKMNTGSRLRRSLI